MLKPPKLALFCDEQPVPTTPYKSYVYKLTVPSCPNTVYVGRLNSSMNTRIYLCTIVANARHICEMPIHKRGQGQVPSQHWIVDHAEELQMELLAVCKSTARAIQVARDARLAYSHAGYTLVNKNR